MFPMGLVLIASTPGSGSLFQGRSKAILVAPDGPNLEVSRYIHFNHLQAFQVFA
jgi:hypothetical protein